jgi:hypothetical protein
MSDNKNSFTYKEYVRRKHIFKFIGLTLGIFTLWLIYSYLKMIQATSYTLPGIIVASIIALIVFKFIKYWDKQNKRDLRWNYHTWGKGAGAELTTQKSLDQLPSDCKTIADFNTGHGNIDFIVIGSKGIMTIEVKSNNGIVSYVNNQLLINGRPTIKDYITQTVAEKLKLIEILKQQFNKFYPVTGLLEFPYGRIDRNSIHGKLPDHDIWIGQQSFHKYLIENSMSYLSQEEIERIYAFLMSSKK